MVEYFTTARITPAVKVSAPGAENRKTANAVLFKGPVIVQWAFVAVVPNAPAIPAPKASVSPAVPADQVFVPAEVVTAVVTLKLVASSIPTGRKLAISEVLAAASVWRSISYSTRMVCPFTHSISTGLHMPVC